MIERGIAKEELVSLIEANALLFSQIHGMLSGKRQAKRDLISNETDLVALVRLPCQLDNEVFS